MTLEYTADAAREHMMDSNLRYEWFDRFDEWPEDSLENIVDPAAAVARDAARDVEDELVDEEREW